MIIEARIIPREIKIRFPKVWVKTVKKMCVVTFYYDRKAVKVKHALVHGEEVVQFRRFVEVFGENQTSEMMEECVMVAEAALHKLDRMFQIERPWKPRKR